MNKPARFLIGAVASGVGACFAFGGVMYEKILNRKFINYKNDTRRLSDELFGYYGTPEEQADADAWFVAMRPEDFSVVNSSGDTMHCYIFKQKEYTDKWAVVVHGYTSCPRGMAEQCRYFYKKGYNVLAPTLRAFGDDTQKYCSMGYKDKYYVIDWIDYIIALDPDAQIVILGVSMGSATTMMVTGEKLPANVKCAVADCGYTSAWDEFANEMTTNYKMPVFPLLHVANIISNIRGNFDFKKCSPLQAVARSVTPTLFIHGELDDFVPYWMMDKLFNACTAEKEKLSVPDAHHAESCDIHPEIYYPAIDKFLAKYI